MTKEEVIKNLESLLAMLREGNYGLVQMDDRDAEVRAVIQAIERLK